MGSFGVVWAAHCEGFGEVAVKEIICQTETELSRAVYEAQLLHLLANVPSASRMTREAVRVPAYVGSETVTDRSGACCVRLAMSRVAGEPLDRFLQERQAQLRASHDGRKDDSRERLRRVAEACRFAHALTTQLTPTMECIATLAYHRDVNAHNILISVDERAEGAEPQYGLVDFGLAVDGARWMDRSASNPHGQGEWEFLDVGGDCRYWPTSAWLQFEVGCYELAEERALCREYQTHLDLQGLGITALQVLAEMLPPFPSSGTAQEAPILAEFQRLLGVWEEYWEAATRFWAALLDTFRSNGDWNALKNEFISLGVHGVISSRLKAVRAVLADLEKASRRAPTEYGLSECGPFFAALAVLISAGEDRGGPATWEEVRACLGRSRGDLGRPSCGRSCSSSGGTISSQSRTFSANASTASTAATDRAPSPGGVKKGRAALAGGPQPAAAQLSQAAQPPQAPAPEIQPQRAAAARRPPAEPPEPLPAVQPSPDAAGSHGERSASLAEVLRSQNDAIHRDAEAMRRHLAIPGSVPLYRMTTPRGDEAGCAEEEPSSTSPSAASPAPAAPPQGWPEDGPAAEELFELMDRDGDGVISRSDFAVVFGPAEAGLAPPSPTKPPPSQPARPLAAGAGAGAPPRGAACGGDLFLKLSGLAGKVAELACEMERLEQLDRERFAAGPLGRGAAFRAVEPAGRDAACF